MSRRVVGSRPTLGRNLVKNQTGLNAGYEEEEAERPATESGAFGTAENRFFRGG
jgi:hypothetical protein